MRSGVEKRFSGVKNTFLNLFSVSTRIFIGEKRFLDACSKLNKRRDLTIFAQFFRRAV